MRLSSGDHYWPNYNLNRVQLAMAVCYTVFLYSIS